MTNRSAVLDRIEDFKKRLDHVADLIKAEDENAIWEFFDNGRKKRKEMEIHKKGGVESAFDIFVDVPAGKTLSLALWNCYEERLWLTFVLMRKIVRIFTVSYKLLLKMKRSHTC